jgi:hypothetical protein
MVDANAVTSSHYPRPLHEPYGTTGSSIVGFVKRSRHLLTRPSSIIHTHHFANIDRKRTAKRTGERLGTLTARRYVPRSVFVGDLAWVIEMVESNAVTSLRYHRLLHEPYGTTGPSIVGFVKRSWYLLTGPRSLIHTHHFANIDGKRTAKRTGVRLGTLTARRYVPRSVFVGDCTSIIEVVDTNAVTSSRYPDRCTNPTACEYYA